MTLYGRVLKVTDEIYMDRKRRVVRFHIDGCVNQNNELDVEPDGDFTCGQEICIQVYDKDE